MIITVMVLQLALPRAATWRALAGDAPAFLSYVLSFVYVGLNTAHPIPAPVPTAVYGIVLLLAALAWIPLLRTLMAANGGEESGLAAALRRDWKTVVSPIGYLVGIVLAFFAPILSCVIYGVIAALWFVPDRRLEARLRT